MILTDKHCAILNALAPDPAGLSTRELTERLQTGPNTIIPRADFGRFAADFGVPLGELVRSGLVHRGAMHAGWRITDAGRVALSAATEEEAS